MCENKLGEANAASNQKKEEKAVRVYHCNDCGGVIYRHEVFCSNCGKQLEHFDFEE